jgi:RNA polymerase sigma-70 factor (ECF subfamily)
MSHPETRHSLIVRLKDERNELAWTEFACLYEPFLYRLCERQGVPQHHVPDVVQQILLAVAKSVDRWKYDTQTASFRRWLSTVARNIVIKFMTKERKHGGAKGGTEVVELMQAVADEPDQEQIRRYEHELIVWAAEQVKSEFIDSSWAAFWATTIDGRSVNEVALELKITPGSIYMSRSRIMARIKSKVSEVID